MNAVLLHYANGSATADWLREARAIEAAEDFAALSQGPLLPEPVLPTDLEELPACAP